MRRALRRTGALAAALALTASACGGDSGASADGGGDGSLTVSIGYQSKTINTVTAGTLLRDLGYFEEELEALGEETGIDYTVDWQDYPSGPPITAQMIAGAIDIGSMGDYPLMVNGAESQAHDDARSQFVSVTGYNLRGSLNAVVVPVDSDARTLADLEGEQVSTSVGSTAHGNLVAALDREGLSSDAVEIVNQEPSVGMTALDSGQVAALAQFVPFPEVAIHQGFARKLYDLGDVGVPTFHAVVLREQFADQQPGVVEAFLRAQVRATEYIHENPLEAALTVAEITGLDAEVVYLFNGPNGIVTFDPTIKEPLVEALGEGLPFLQDLGSVSELDIEGFTHDSYLREVWGDGYDEAAAGTDNPSTLAGTDEVCGLDVNDPATASEAWFEGEDATQVAATPTCLLRRVAASDAELRAGYVPDSDTGTRMFAATASWVDDPSGGETGRFLPFATLAAAESYVTEHPGASVEDFATVLAAAGG